MNPPTPDNSDIIELVVSSHLSRNTLPVKSKIIRLIIKNYGIIRTWFSRDIR